MPSGDAGRGLNPATFASLMSRLGPDAERAGAAYEALRRAILSFCTAQIEMSRQKRWAAPFYWAGFILQGEWR